MKTFRFGILIGLFAALALGAAGCDRPSPESALRAFYLALSESNYEAAKQYVDPDLIVDKKKMTVEQQLRRWSVPIRGMGQMRMLEMTRLDASDLTHASAKVRITALNGQSRRDTVSVIYKDGGWKIAK